LDRWKGKFDRGYEEHRKEWFERQLELGIIPEGTTLAPKNWGVPAWEDLTEAQQKFANRLQEAYAAMLEHTDDQIGRVVAFLDEMGLRDNTVIMVCSDNGASQEGGPYGVMDEFSTFNQFPEDIEEIAANRLDDIGGPHSHSNYPWGWAQAGNSPLRWYKQNTYGGGVRDPLIVNWPEGISAHGEIRHQFVHAVDLAATVLDIAGVEVPEIYNGHPQIPLAGASMLETFASADAPSPRNVQYFEQMGHRGIYADGWKAVTWHMGGTPFENDNWELFNLEEDFSECNNVAERYPEKLTELIELWWSEAGKHGVLPLDDRTIELFGAAPRPGSPHARRRYEYFPPISHIPADASPLLAGRPFILTASVEITDSAEGVIYARGTHAVGQTLFIKGGVLNFDYNAHGNHTRVAAPVALDPGDHELGVRFDRVGKQGQLTIFCDGNDLAQGDVPFIARIMGSTGMDLGRDSLSQVVEDYDDEFAFTGHLTKVVFDLPAKSDATDASAHMASELGRE
jgi:arylsulfatase